MEGLPVVEELPVLALLCGQLAPTHLSEQCWATQLLGALTNPSGQMGSGNTLPSEWGYDSVFFMGVGKPDCKNGKIPHLRT